MMRGELLCWDGRRIRLPDAVEWRFQYGCGTPCDSFQITCLWEPDSGNDLAEAVSFTAEENGERLFTGVVDECERGWDTAGGTLTVAGRGMAARLLDNEALGADYQVATVEDILRDHVAPYGCLLYTSLVKGRVLPRRRLCPERAAGRAPLLRRLPSAGGTQPCQLLLPVQRQVEGAPEIVPRLHLFGPLLRRKRAKALEHTPAKALIGRVLQAFFNPSSRSSPSSGEGFSARSKAAHRPASAPISRALSPARAAPPSANTGCPPRSSARASRQALAHRAASCLLYTSRCV